MDLFDRHVSSPAPHGNQRLHLRGVVGILLAAAYEPSVRSLRTIDDLSLLDHSPARSGVPRVARSTLSLVGSAPRTIPRSVGEWNGDAAS